MQSTPYHIAIAGFGNAHDAAPATSIAHAMRDGSSSGIEITAIVDQGMMTGAWLPGLVDHLRRQPPRMSDNQTVFEWLLDTHREHPIDGIIPCTQRWLASIAALAPRLERERISTLVPALDRVPLLTRSRLPKFLYDHGLAAPLSIFVANTDDVATCSHQLGFPLLVKGERFGCHPVHSPEQAQQATKALNGAAGAGVLLQREVAGQVLDVAAIVGRSGKLAAAVAMRRVATDERGRAVCGAVVDDPLIDDRVTQLVDALDWCGPLEITLLKPAGSQELQVLDVRGGLPSWSMLSEWAGCNLTIRLLQEMFKETPSKAPRAKVGTLFVRGITEATVPYATISRIERHGASPGVISCNDARVSDIQPYDKLAGLRVAVTGLSTFDVVNPGLGVARALREAPGVSTVYGLGYGNFDSGAYSAELFDAAFRLPVSNDPSNLLERLREIHSEHPFDVVVPCLDGELDNFIAIKPDLDEIGVGTLLPDKEALQRRSKPSLFGPDVRSDWGAFQIPESRIVGSDHDLLRAVSKLGLPCVVKGPVSHCHVVQSLADAKSAWQQIQRSGEDKAIVQVHIPGPCFAVATVCGADHGTLASLSVKKLAVCDRGSTWSAVHAPQPALEEDFACFLAHIGWAGAAEGEFIRDSLRDRFYLIEINPRFTAWIYFSVALGSNHPHLLARTAAGQPVPPASTPTDDWVFVRGTREMPIGASSLAALSMKGAVYHGKA